MKKNIWRILFWGLILILCITLGTVGYLENRRKNDEAGIVLNRIKNILDNSYIINRYKEANTEININVNKNKLFISFSSVTEDEYVYVLENNILSTKYNKNDSAGRDILMAVTDSIAVLNGEASDQVYSIFQNNKIDNFTIDEGIEITYNLNSVEVLLNTNVAVTPRVSVNQVSYFLYEDFSEEEKENYDLIKTKGNIIFIRENENEFAIAEIGSISNDAKESLKNIIIYFYGTEYSNRLDNVDFTNKTDYKDELIEILFNPDENEIESDHIATLIGNMSIPENGGHASDDDVTNYELLRVKINIE